jgi:hypothetical protein
MAYEQTVAIIDKYMQNNPAEWHQSMASLVWVAMNEACTPKEKKGK